MPTTPYVGVPRDFDDQLEALITYIQQQGWTITGLDEGRLAEDLVQQRADRQRHFDLERQMASFRQAFLAAQSERYARYMQALEVLRAAHRNDPEVQKALAQFKRRSRRAPASAAPTGEEADAL